jgi:hypothetical protein
MDIVGEKEIAQRLLVPTNTVHQWSKRNLLPPTDGTVSGAPAWAWATIQRWAQSTGRLPGLREEILASLARGAGATSQIAGSLIAAGYAKSISQVWRVLNDLADEGLVGRAMPDSWIIDPARRDTPNSARVADDERHVPSPVVGGMGQSAVRVFGPPVSTAANRVRK